MHPCLCPPLGKRSQDGLAADLEGCSVPDADGEASSCVSSPVSDPGRHNSGQPLKSSFSKRQQKQFKMQLSGS